MSYYALIKNGIVENLVVWDGEGDLFGDFQTYELIDGDVVGPGFSAETDSKGKWTFTAPVITITPEEQSAINLQKAQSEYEGATAKITSLSEQLQDEDFTESSELSLKTSLSAWTTYRKALRAYIASNDGGKALPNSPKNP